MSDWTFPGQTEGVVPAANEPSVLDQAEVVVEGSPAETTPTVEPDPAPPPADLPINIIDPEEQRKAEFVNSILEARQPVPVPPPQPTHPRILEQTNKELAEGARQNQIHAAQQANRPQRQPTVADLAAEGKTVSVFRPHTYTHEQGNVQGKGLNTGNI